MPISYGCTQTYGRRAQAQSMVSRAKGAGVSLHFTPRYPHPIPRNGDAGLLRGARDLGRSSKQGPK